MKKLLFGLGIIAFSGCKTNYENLPAFSEKKQLQVVIEAGQEKIVRFLPYPFNTGFIPSTRTPEHKPVHVLLLSESLETGTITETIPLGVLLLERAGELEYQIVTVPAKPS